MSGRATWIWGFFFCGGGGEGNNGKEELTLKDSGDHENRLRAYSQRRATPAAMDYLFKMNFTTTMSLPVLLLPFLKKKRKK